MPVNSTLLYFYSTHSRNQLVTLMMKHNQQQQGTVYMWLRGRFKNLLLEAYLGPTEFNYAFVPKDARVLWPLGGV